MHQIGVSNTVAPCGTALTIEQAQLLKRYTNKVTLIYDGDKAGKKAILKNAELLIKEGFYVHVIPLPEHIDPKDEESPAADPDSYFLTVDFFEDYADKHRIDFIPYKVSLHKDKAMKDMVYKNELIREVSALIASYEDSSLHDVYIEGVSAILKPVKAWKETVGQLVAVKEPAKKERKSKIPKSVNREDMEAWGFYEDKNHYYFRNRNGEDWISQSNFTMKPLFLIDDPMNAKRLYEITNYRNETRIVEIPQKDLVSITAFNVRVESLGNFLWNGSIGDLNKLKGWLYEQTRTANEIKQLGWHKDGFFAWGNGIYNTAGFQASDEFGIVQHGEKFYYIPSSSRIYEKDTGLFEFERKFIHYESNISLRDYFKKYITVFGDNGKVALSFYISSLFLDLIGKRFDKYPLLNLFGPKGAGKNACAESLLHFFGHAQGAPNLHNTSKAALADHVATSSNAVCILDEYRNDLEMEKREFLKGLWDKTGRTRMNMDKDKKKETSSVAQGVVLCGQQMATADIALFSRFIVLSFTQTKYTEAEELAYLELKDINKKGLTHITHQLLKYRDYFASNYNNAVGKVDQDFRKLIGNTSIESRTYNNWLTVISAYATLEEQLQLPWDYSDFMKLCVELMMQQNQETGRNDDLGTFWAKVQYLINSNLIFAKGDYKVVPATTATRRYYQDSKWQTELMEWKDTKELLYIVPSRIMELYKQQTLKGGDKPMPEATVEYYLRNSEAFLFETKKESFQRIDPKTGRQDSITKTDKTTGQTTIKKLHTSTTALVFDLVKLDISLPIESDENGDALPF